MNNELSLAFIDHNPPAAARALSTLSVVDAAAYLASIPARYSVRSLSCMSTWSAARLIQAMPGASAGAILRALPYLRSAAILRLVPPADRGSLLESLPRGLRKDFKITMSYPSDTVGGQMATDMVIAEPNHTAADIRHVLQETERFHGDSVFIVDDRRKYLGSIDVCSLFRLADSTKMNDTPLNRVEPLLARQSLESAGDSDRWQECHYLPVVGRAQHLIGVLAMHQMLSVMGLRAGPEDEQAVPNTLVETYLDTAKSLITQLAGRRAPQTRRNHS